MIKRNEKYLGIVDDYEHHLLELYKKSGNTEKQKPLIKEFIFYRMEVDFTYYNEYKSFFNESEWKKELESILNSAKFTSQIEEILFEKK